MGNEPTNRVKRAGERLRIGRRSKLHVWALAFAMSGLLGCPKPTVPDVSTGSVETAAPSDADPWIRAYYDDDQWSLLSAPGNLLAHRTQRYRPEEAVSGGTLRRWLRDPVPDLNPITVNRADTSELGHYVYSTLGSRQRNSPDRWVSDLALRVEANSDYTEYHVWLRDDVVWEQPYIEHAGAAWDWARAERALVADDFVFFFEIVSNPEVAPHLANYYSICSGIEVINDFEFIVRWDQSTFQSSTLTLGMQPLPRWLYGAETDGSLIPPDEVPSRFAGHWYSEHMVGVGPYRYAGRLEDGGVRMERSDSHWGEPPAIDAIEYHVIPDRGLAGSRLVTGDLDAMYLNHEEYQYAVLEGGVPGFRSGELCSARFRSPSYRYIGWNADRPLFADRLTRLAMTHAFNRWRGLDALLARITTGNFFIDGPDYDSTIEPWPFDLDRAAELLEEAGWMDADGDGVREREIDGKLVVFEFSMVTYGYRPRYVEAMVGFAEDLATIGVSMTVEPLDWAEILDRMTREDFDAYTGGWVLGWESDPYQIWHSSQAEGGSNRVGFRNAQADALIETARRTFDSAERSRIFHEFHRLVHNEQPYTFWFSADEVLAWNSRVRGVEFSPLRPFTSSLSWWIDDSVRASAPGSEALLGELADSVSRAVALTR